MWDDDEQLDEELNWKPRRNESFWRTPRGASAIMALGMALSLPMWGATMDYVGSASDLGVFALLLVFAVEGLIGMAIARFLWRVIGPIPRGFIRPFMILGPLPPLAVLCCTGQGLAHRLTPDTGFSQQGKNWGVPRGGRRVPFQEVQALCAKQGPAWRMPREDEVAKLEPQPSATQSARFTYWVLPVSPTNTDRRLVLDVICIGPRCSGDVRPWSTGYGESSALCVNF